MNRRSTFPEQPWLGLAAKISELCPKCASWNWLVSAALQQSKERASASRAYLQGVNVLYCVSCPVAQACGGWPR